MDNIMCVRFLVSYIARIFILFSTLLFSSMILAKSTENDHWLNHWDKSCYVDGDNTCREEWYSTTQGSHLLMWEVFIALEKSDSNGLFIEQSNLSKFGFLYPNIKGETTSNYNRDTYTGDYSGDLPLGLLLDKSQINNVNYMGLTCAACHTGEITYANKRFFVEAGQSPLNMSEFFSSLVEALDANTKGEKLWRFSTRFMLNEFFNNNANAHDDYAVDALGAESYLLEALDAVRGFVERDEGIVVNGPGRLDAVGSIINQVFVHQAGLDDNGESEIIPLSAPVSYPYIWDATRLQCIQTNCIATNPLTRNIGEVSGVFGILNLDDDEDINDLEELAYSELGLNNLFEYSAKIDNLYRLEKVLGYIKSPKWPKSFPALDKKLMASGKVIYQSECAGCHINVSDGIDESELTAPNSVGYQFTKVTKVAYDEVGTDPAFALDYGLRTEPTGIIGAVLQVTYPDIYPAPPEILPALAISGVATGTLASQYFASQAFSEKAVSIFPLLSEQEAIQLLTIEYVAGQVDAQAFTPTVYRAKPLNGIAFTGPFLHNGSVRTLADLLNKPEDRARSFYVGSTEFDAQNIGFIDEGHFLFDTTIRGNSNAGHRYGIDLSDNDKASLLEYMKSM